MSKKDYYDVLGVAKSATKDELKKAGLDANIKTGDEKKVVNPEKVMNKT